MRTTFGRIPLPHLQNNDWTCRARIRQSVLVYDTSGQKWLCVSIDIQRLFVLVSVQQRTPMRLYPRALLVDRQFLPSGMIYSFFRTLHKIFTTMYLVQHRIGRQHLNFMRVAIYTRPPIIIFKYCSLKTHRALLNLSISRYPIEVIRQPLVYKVSLLFRSPSLGSPSNAFFNDLQKIAPVHSCNTHTIKEMSFSTIRR